MHGWWEKPREGGGRMFCRQGRETSHLSSRGTHGDDDQQAGAAVQDHDVPTNPTTGQSINQSITFLSPSFSTSLTPTNNMAHRRAIGQVTQEVRTPSCLCIDPCGLARVCLCLSSRRPPRILCLRSHACIPVDPFHSLSSPTEAFTSRTSVRLIVCSNLSSSAHT